MTRVGEPSLVPRDNRSRLRIVADEKIALVREAFAEFGEVVVMPGSAIDRHAVRDADVLLVRTVTRVDRALLANTRSTFVATATAGIDHVDVEALRELGIGFAHAPGANANAVAEYVLAALSSVALGAGALSGALGSGVPSGALGSGVPSGLPILGVVGFGHVGRRVTRLFRVLGGTVIVCDPPLADARVQVGVQVGASPAVEGDPDDVGHAGEQVDASAASSQILDEVARETFVSLPELLSACDVVSLHVPLVEHGPYPTTMLLDDDALARIKPGAWVINTSRGGVLNERAALGLGLRLVLDVWQREPALDWALLEGAAFPGLRIATPHIAGYTLEAKIEATAMIHAACARHLGVEPRFGFAAARASMSHHVAGSGLVAKDVEASQRTAWVESPGSPVPDVEAIRVAGLAGDPGVPAMDTEVAWVSLRAAASLHERDRELRGLLGLAIDQRAAAFERLRSASPLRRECMTAW